MGFLDDNIVQPVHSFFFPQPTGSGSYGDLEMRRKLAIAAMSRERKTPTTIGAGIDALGAGIGMRMMRSDLADAEQAATAKEKALYRNAPDAAGGDISAGNEVVGPLDYTSLDAQADAASPARAATASAAPDEALDPGTYNFLDAQADAGGRGPRFRTANNSELDSRQGITRAIVGLRPEMQARVMAAYEGMPDNLKAQFSYNEGARSPEYQKYLYDTRADRGPVAPPGSSQHEFGAAIDVDRGPALDWLHQNASQYGLAGIGGDYPHIQMARGDQRTFADPANPARLPIPGTRPYFADAAVAGAEPDATSAMAFAPEGTGQATAALPQPPPTGAGAGSPAPPLPPPTSAAPPSPPAGVLPVPPGALSAAPMGIGGGFISPQTARSAANNPPIATSIQPAPRPPMPQSMAGTAVPPPVMPRDPGPEPQMPQPTRAMQYWQAAARDSSLSPTVRADAAKQYSDLSKEQKDDYVRHWTIWKGERIKADDPATALALRSSQLGVVKTMRELEGEGWEPVPADKMALLPKVAEGQTYWQDRQGNLKFGPRPPGSVNIDQKAQGAGLVKMQQEMADHIVGQFKEGTTASDDLRSIAGMRVLMSRVDTGLPAVAKQFAGRMGIKTEGISDIEALNAAIMRMVPQQRVPGTGATSDFDAHMFQASVPELMKTREGNMMIMDTMESAARNKLARSEIAGKVMSGQMEMPEGIKALLKLQMEAKSISDNVRAYVENKGIKLPSSVLPGQAEQDDAARAWLAANPNHPKAPAVRQSLGGQ